MSFIKLDRALLDWRFKHKPNYVALWIHMLMKANYEPSEFEDIQLSKGEFATSINHLAEDCGLSVQNVRTILKHMDGQEITMRSTNKFTLIKIIKWDKYQCSADETNKQSNKQLTNNQQTTNNRIRNKEIKKGINIYNIDRLPVYDTSKNPVFTKEEEEEIMSLMGRQRC